MFKVWMEFAMISGGVLFVLSEIILPMITSNPLFPLFRNKDLKKKIEEARLKRERDVIKTKLKEGDF